jgi:drug/metabolite transporter (DMT)-like permease
VFQNSNTKGYLFAIIATLALSNVYIFSKAALNEVNLAQFGFYWFGFAIAWNLIYSILFKQLKNTKKLSIFQLKNLLGIGVVEVIATTAIFVAIQTIPNPTIPALLRNIEPVLIVIFAIFLLKEKYTRVELMGVALTIAGTFIISYNKFGTINSLLIPGVEFMLISSIFYAIRTIWSKKVIHHFTALALNLNKVSFLFITAALALLLTNSSLIIPTRAFYYLLAGSFIGPFLTSYTQILALKYIDASRATLVQSSTGFITLFLSYIYFGKLPFTYQIIGGFIAILGLAMVTLKRKR